MALELNIQFSDIPDTNEIHEKLQDAKLRHIKERIQEAVYLDDMQDFDPDISIELQSKCFVPVIKGSVGLRDFDFEAIKSYFGVANIN